MDASKINHVTKPEHIKYCTQCGSKVHKTVPKGDDKLRYVCTDINCGHIQYQNPKIITGTISVHKGKILLCKRAIEPRYGFWTLPAGFMENHESSIDGAIRETWEEAGAKANIIKLFSVINVLESAQLHLFYLAEFDGVYSSGIESIDTQLFQINDIPWDELAFNSVRQALLEYIASL
jgi:ADP-ribose pyrophosphatase YjhB (NUDIX family)